MRGRLGRAWDAVPAWQGERPVRNRLPIPQLVVDAMSISAVLEASRSPKHASLFWSFACLIRIGFNGLCRPGEVLILRPYDLNFSHRIGEEPLVVAVERPKNRGALGRTQFRMITDLGASQWLEWYCREMPRHARIWPHGPQKFRAVWDFILENLGLQTVGFTPACLRAGGATALFRSGLPVSSLKFRGGWASERSLACYIQETMTSLIWSSLDASVTDRLEELVLRHQALLSSAPPRPRLEHFPRRHFRGVQTASRASLASRASSPKPSGRSLSTGARTSTR